MLTKTVEIDETYVGGKEKNKHKNKRQEGTQGRSTKTKAAVLGILERGGKVYAKKITKVDGATVKPIMRANVGVGAVICTDEWTGYQGLGNLYHHKVVNHGKGEYVFGDAHTNTIEGFWSLLKRGIIGIYHFVSPKHLDRYCTEFSFRYNTREISQQDRLNQSIAQSKGKRLKYHELIA